MPWEPAIFTLPRGEWTPALEETMESCEDPMWVFDVDEARIPWANPLAQEFWNASSSTVLAERDFAEGMSTSTKRRLAAYQRIISRGEPVHDRWTLFPGGRPQTMRFVIGPVPGEHGCTRLLFRGRPCETTQADVRGVEALRHTSVMITLCALSGEVLMQNPAAAEAYGDLVHVTSPNGFRIRFVSGVDADAVEHALSQRGEFHGEVRVRTSRGEVWHGVDALHTTDPATGQPAILIDETNIDGRKRGELELAAARLELESRVEARTRDVARQRAFVEGILDTTPSFMFVSDADGALVRANRAVRWLLERDAVRDDAMAWELLGSTSPEMFKSWLRDAPPADLEVERVGASGARTVIYWTLQVFAVHGERFLVGSGLDITERREMQLRLQTNDRMAALGTLASGVAHEINNPLAYVLTSVELALGRVRAGEASDSVPHLVAAAEACERAAKIVADLKGFAHPPGPTTAVDLRAIVDSARRMMAHLLVDRRMFHCSIEESIWVRGDETKLCQVVLNLLVNAAEACEEAGAEACIAVSCHVDGDAAVLVIDDTGSGMPESVRVRIFDPFYTTKGRRQGTGLGLSITHRIVQQLGGSITVHSRAGEGSTFRVRLLASAPPVTQQDVCRPATATVRARVLIVDDEPGLAEAFALALTDHDVATAGSGVEALACIDAYEFDLIVCDMSMPEMDGPSLHAALAAKDPELASRMLFVTGGAFTPQAHDFVRSMIGRVLYKPVAARALREGVHQMLEAKGPRPRP